MKIRQLFIGYLLWLVVGGAGLWYVPKPWNLDVGILFVLVLFALPDWINGSYSGRFLKNESGWFDWAKIQFVAWYSVILGGLLTFGAIRLHAGIINPLNVNMEGTVALVLGTSAIVLLARGLNGLAVDVIRKRARKDVEVPSALLFHTAYIFLTLLFVLSQIYLLWTTLKITVPALLANYPTISWGFALIYLVAGIVVSVVDLLTTFRPIGKTE
jgi:hypothetical protein